MNAKSALLSLVAALCLSGMALAQSRDNSLRTNKSPVLRMSSLETIAPSQDSDTDEKIESSRTVEPLIGPPPLTAAGVYDDVIMHSAWAGYSGGGGWHGCGNCGDCGYCCNSNSCYAYLGGLGMGRDAPNKFWTTYESTDPENQLQYFPNSNWGGGVETYFGFWFGCDDCCDSCCGNSCGCNRCGRFGIQAVYWGIWGMDGQSNLYDPTDNLSTPIDTGLVTIEGVSATGFFDNARQHRLRRDDEVHNVEINGVYAMGDTGGWQLWFLAGVRFLRFGEDLQFGTLAGGAPVDATIDTDPTEAALLDVNVRNNLVGFQIGANATWWIHDRVGIFMVPKLGIFGNHVSARNVLTRGDGPVATFDLTGNRFDIRPSENAFSFLASIDLGLNWQFTDNWSLLGGYRVVAISGIALSDDQIPAFLAAEDEWADIETNGDLILHGAFAGLEYRY